jgi:hypothetical protein
MALTPGMSVTLAILYACPLFSTRPICLKGADAGLREANFGILSGNIWRMLGVELSDSCFSNGGGIFARRSCM